MTRRGLREADLADACGCSPENIRQIFDGGDGLRCDTVDKLCRSLGQRVVVSLEEERPR
jgi:DNA-binding Xre family transcriptional regulator